MLYEVITWKPDEASHILCVTDVDALDPQSRLQLDLNPVPVKVDSHLKCNVQLDTQLTGSLNRNNFV